MPIQNVGTLLENIVVVESVRLVIGTKATKTSNNPLEFVCSFAMPPLSKWGWNAQNAGFSDAVLDTVVGAEFGANDASYPALLHDCLTYNREKGPNGALLAAGVSTRSGAPYKMWLNDIRDGHYENALPDLANLNAIHNDVYCQAPIPPTYNPNVCPCPYPDSIKDLMETLGQWCHAHRPCGRVAFLDPNRYRINGRNGPQTSSADHRDWLRAVQAPHPVATLAVHFTGNQYQPHLEQELASLHKDAVASGYIASLAFRRQHYAVFVAVSIPTENDQGKDGTGHTENHDPFGTVNELQDRVEGAWQAWFRNYAPRNNAALTVYRNGRIVGRL